ncbi:MAG: hypothetical protein KDH90_15165, partial [Anaerolineae bacterium]|nr:hypothetical protein [Anaerolineae bacterium]
MTIFDFLEPFNETDPIVGVHDYQTLARGSLNKLYGAQHIRQSYIIHFNLTEALVGVSHQSAVVPQAPAAVYANRDTESTSGTKTANLRTQLPPYLSR